MAKAKDKRTKGAKGSVTNPTSGAAQLQAEQNRAKTIKLRALRMSYPQIAKSVGVSISTAHGYVQKTLQEFREEGIDDAPEVFAEESAVADRGIAVLEALAATRIEAKCPKCKEVVKCPGCGETQEVPKLKPEGFTKNRLAILRHSESKRILYGVDATKHVIIEGQVDAALVDIFRGLRDSGRGEAADAVAAFVKERAQGNEPGKPIGGCKHGDKE